MNSNLNDGCSDQTLANWQALQPRSWKRSIFITSGFVLGCVSVWGSSSFFFDVDKRVLESSLLLALLTGLTFFDVRHRILPDILTLTLVVFGLVWNFWWAGQVLGSIAGAVIGFLIFQFLNMAWKSKTGNTGLGMGDAKLLAGGGAVLGAMKLPFIILMSSVGALFFVMIARLFKENGDQRSLLEFGPFICGSVWILWITNIGP